MVKIARKKQKLRNCNSCGVICAICVCDWCLTVNQKLQFILYFKLGPSDTTPLMPTHHKMKKTTIEIARFNRMCYYLINLNRKLSCYHS